MRDRIPNLKKEDKKKKLYKKKDKYGNTALAERQRFTFRQLHSIFITGHVPSKTVGHTVAEHTTTRRQTPPSRPSQAEGYYHKPYRPKLCKIRTTTLHITISSEAYIFHLTHAA